ncbi:hypothetical protein POX_e06296 [Penicillium oxalicum]|uniref:hypothetical protein n=1 Tax=Penicillium oxalicum TaxID=69781 RepID=UPI0020B7D0B4|nr:hypothetical protein POX_e06296 [Penicillium oxalicum]KAI2788282.1 hypothetical protein POX_e06296 [Penicillium oxalicum]
MGVSYIDVDDDMLLPSEGQALVQGGSQDDIRTHTVFPRDAQVELGEERESLVESYGETLRSEMRPLLQERWRSDAPEYISDWAQRETRPGVSISSVSPSGETLSTSSGTEKSQDPA